MNLLTGLPFLGCFSTVPVARNFFCMFCTVFLLSPRFAATWTEVAPSLRASTTAQRVAVSEWAGIVLVQMMKSMRHDSWSRKKNQINKLYVCGKRLSYKKYIKDSAWPLFSLLSFICTHIANYYFSFRMTRLFYGFQNYSFTHFIFFCGSGLQLR